MAWSSNGPESSLVHVVVFFAKHFRILVSFRARSIGHRSVVVSESGLHTHGVSVPGARYPYKGRRTDIPPVIDMEPPQH